MSDSVVVDTGVFSYLYKGDTRASLYAKHLIGQQLHLSFVTSVMTLGRIIECTSITFQA
jgi:hypothetical protein